MQSYGVQGDLGFLGPVVPITSFPNQTPGLVIVDMEWMRIQLYLELCYSYI